MKLYKFFKGGEVFINKNGAIIVISRLTHNDLIEYRISSSAANYYDRNYEYQLISGDAFLDMLKANNYRRI